MSGNPPMHNPSRRGLHVRGSLEFGVPHSVFVDQSGVQPHDLVVLQGLFYEDIALGVTGIGEVDSTILFRAGLGFLLDAWRGHGLGVEHV